MIALLKITKLTKLCLNVLREKKIYFLTYLLTLTIDSNRECDIFAILLTPLMWLHFWRLLSQPNSV